MLFDWYGQGIVLSAGQFCCLDGQQDVLANKLVCLGELQLQNQCWHIKDAVYRSDARQTDAPVF
jgi:hypothetical protein